MARSSRIQGHLSLGEQQPHNQKRLITAAIAGLLCLALGLGLVALLKPPEEAQDAQASAQAPQEPQEPAAALAPDPTQGEEPAEEPPQEQEPPAQQEQAAQEPEEPTEAAKEEEPAKDEEPAQEEPAQAEAPAQAQEPAQEEGAAQDGPWWERARGKRCKIVFPEEHNRLVMREGELRRDEVTTYGPFLENPVVARVRKGWEPEVTVHHIGIHPRNKRPSLAYITLHSDAGDKTGILPLQIAKDQVILKPVSGR